ncbi:MAG: MASE1 domain-containing protein [Pseudomonadota bacterium]
MVAKPRDSATIPALAQGGLSKTGAFVRGLGFAALYLAAMVGVIAYARADGAVSPIWVANAVLAWAMITAPTRDWPIYIILSAIAHFIGAIFVGDLGREGAYIAANMSEAVVFAGLMRWRQIDLDFEERGSVLWFLLIGGVIAPGVSTAIESSGALLHSGHFDIRDALTWYLSDGLGYVVFLPIIKVVADNDWRELIAPNTRLRAFILFAILFAAHALAWNLPYDLRRFFTIIVVPYIIYIAFELGLTGARTAIAVNATLIVAYALSMKNPVGSGMTPGEYLFVVEVYLAALCACILPLAAALAEKQRLYETASEALSEAQAAWGELIAAEALYRLIADNTHEMILRVGLDDAILFASPACKALTPGVDELYEHKLSDLVHADDRATHAKEVEALILEGALDRPRHWQIRLRNLKDDWALYDVRATLVAQGGGEPHEYVAVLRLAQDRAAA